MLQKIAVFPQLGHTSGVNSVAFSPDGKQLLSGSGSRLDYTSKLFGSSDNTLKLWDAASGRELRTFSGPTDWVSSVAFSPDGKQILSGSGDGTTGKEIAAFISFSGSDTQLSANTRGGISSQAAEKAAEISGEWICVTPDGYYAASPRGDRYLNVRIGNKVTGMENFRHIFYNPDVVRARLAGKPDPDSKKTITIQDAAKFFPATITLPPNITTSSCTVKLDVKIVDDNQPVKNIKILVNGRLVGKEELAGIQGAKGLTPEKTSLTVTGNQKSLSFTVPLALDPGENLVEVIAFNSYDAESRQKTNITWQTNITYKPVLPDLWILAIGVNNYDNALSEKLLVYNREGNLLPMRDLSFCANDARKIVDSFKLQKGKLYGEVYFRVIADGEGIEPTAQNIRENLHSFLDKAGPRDTVILFLAGHGATEHGEFYFLPQDAIISPDRVYSNVITGSDISSVLDSQGNRLIFIDACHSGSMDNNRMIRQFMNTNAYVFAACQGDESSFELVKLGHGVFTYSILDTLGKRRGQSILSVIDLTSTVSMDVPQRLEVEGKKQNPVGYSLGFYDFIIGE